MSCDATMNVGYRHGSYRHDRKGNRIASGRRALRQAPGRMFRPVLHTRVGHSTTLVVQALILAMAVAVGGPIAMLFRAADPVRAALQLGSAIAADTGDRRDAVIADACRFTSADDPLPIVFTARTAPHPAAKTYLAARTSLTTTASLAAGMMNAAAPVIAPPTGTQLVVDSHGDVPEPASMKTPKPPEASGSITFHPAADLRASVMATRQAKSLAGPDH